MSGRCGSGERRAASTGAGSRRSGQRGRAAVKAGQWMVTAERPDRGQVKSSSMLQIDMDMERVGPELNTTSSWSTPSSKRKVAETCAADSACHASRYLVLCAQPQFSKDPADIDHLSIVVWYGPTCLRSLHVPAAISLPPIVLCHKQIRRSHLRARARQAHHRAFTPPLCDALQHHLHLAANLLLHVVVVAPP